MTLLTSAVATSACGDRPAADPSSAPEREYVGVGTVLDDGDGPELCLGAVAASYPPQCGGPAVLGWDWDAVEHESADGTRWASYAVTGTWDGAALTSSREPVPAALYDGPAPAGLEPADLSTPCTEPAGGWSPPEPSRASDATLQRAVTLAEGLDAVGEVWLDQRRPGDVGVVLNVRVAGGPESLAEVERRVSAVWGGSLCVSRAERTRTELLALQRELVSRSEELGVLSASPGRDRVELTVLLDDGSLQRELDARHGAGAVQVVSALQPVT